MDAIERVHAGEQVVALGNEDSWHPGTEPYEPWLWPGRQAGLTGREAEILALICQGLSNREIADKTFLSINSVKTYIRTCYRKIGVSKRPQAVLWGVQNGFTPEPMRVPPIS